MNQKRAYVYRLLTGLLLFNLLSTLNFALFNIIQLSDYSDWAYLFQLELLFGFGPSLLLYAKTVVNSSFRVRKMDLLHFIPVVVEFIYYRTPWFYRGAYSLAEPAISYSNWLFFLLQWGGIASLMIYMVWTINVVLQNRWSTQDQLSNGGKWLRLPILIYSLFWLVWISIRMVDILYFHDALREYYFDTGFLLLSCLTIWVGFSGYLKSEIGISRVRLPSIKRISSSEQDKLSEALKSLQQSMHEGQYYLDQSLTLDKFSKKVGCPPKVISKALNQILGVNFHEFVNQYRVEAFKRKLNQDQFAHLSLLGIALESGFGSKSTFNLVFKRTTGLTPRQYQENSRANKS